MRLLRSSDQFCLIADSGSYKIKLLDVKLQLRKVQLSPEIFTRHMSLFDRGNLCIIPFHQAKIQTILMNFGYPQGRVFRDLGRFAKLQIFLILVAADGCDGQVQESEANFLGGFPRLDQALSHGRDDVVKRRGIGEVLGQHQRGGFSTHFHRVLQAPVFGSLLTFTIGVSDKTSLVSHLYNVGRASSSSSLVLEHLSSPSLSLRTARFLSTLFSVFEIFCRSSLHSSMLFPAFIFRP